MIINIYIEFSQIFISCRSSSKKIRKANHDFAREIDFREIKFSIEVRDIHKIKNPKIFINISVFGSGKMILLNGVSGVGSVGA